MWSIGVVLYIILCGKIPFPGDSHKEIIENVLAGEFHFDYAPFKVVSAEAKDLISKLFVRDDKLRLSAEEAFNH